MHSLTTSGRRLWTVTLVAICGLGAPYAQSQTELNFSRLGGVVRIVNTDLAVLESQDKRDDIPCTVVPSKPELGFDLRFHTSYSVTIPLKDLAGSGDQLRVLIRVTPVEQQSNQIYLVDRFSVPA